MRLIDADELKAEEMRISSVMLDGNERKRTTFALFTYTPTEVQRLIDNAPTIDAEPKHGKWIPCSERLPEKDGSYLVCMSWGYYDMNVYMWADGWNCIRRINGEIDRQNEIDGADIIAWMPLPKPYKESEKNHEG